MVLLELSNVNINSNPSLSSNQPEQMQFVEEVGLMFELAGLPRMSGRIFGWLLLSSPQRQSHGQLAEVLQASKGSISTMTRLLIQIGLIERISIPGERRDYFQIRPNAWSQMTKQRMAQITAFKELAAKGLDLLKDSPPVQQQRLREMHDLHAFLEREMPLLDQRWEVEQQQQLKRETVS
ncbi:MAG: MarR family transcriptional regulator [Pegethrix bostrychoides GSE-TBD4-15B]|jgi:DNA-binding transcriptional regulator GbsR (MarR family)|uniref:MarR family transcriptional regulator n=1 Tax=Pegethrix bostrychoides GSE-TBD4-15B TaxID=2839662 RepID=A0A951P8G2_9CYAN|nr:MarR family transcriptional regulator [Pegethrix bostrychoides GSE-TBD4-15B]